MVLEIKDAKTAMREIGIIKFLIFFNVKTEWNQIMFAEENYPLNYANTENLKVKIEEMEEN